MYEFLWESPGDSSMTHEAFHLYYSYPICYRGLYVKHPSNGQQQEGLGLFVFISVTLTPMTILTVCLFNEWVNEYMQKWMIFPFLWNEYWHMKKTP